MKLDTLIRGGTLVDPVAASLTLSNLGMVDGRVAYIGYGAPEATRVIDATGLYVSPGFIDTHMHDEELDDACTMQRALLLQGVTTAIAGNCGSGPLIDEYLPKRRAPMLKLAYQTGHTVLRKAVGIDDVYRPATAGETEKMQVLLRRELDRGSFGLSFGLEYAPNTSPAEIDALASLLVGRQKRNISVHIRYDGPRCLEGITEVIELARRFKVRLQVSHIGSMTAFGYCAEAVRMVEAAKAEGVDMGFDCYPYDAFCTHIGSAVFDPGFEKRWDKGLPDLEVASGKYKGQRMTPESYADLRANDPTALIIAHVMNDAEIRECLAHPSCAIASDGVLHGGQGHPRAAGTFPRALRILREAGLSWPDAVRHATSLPAAMSWLESGRLVDGSPADVVVFDPAALRDKATFADQLAPPEGVAYVFVDGKLAVEHGACAPTPTGRLLFRQP
ncbi:MAG: aminoacylase [Spirochaetae bacterium HGW-Spirochaetae-7]|nr:MAG: aminoacylase [Spirochaetae bacterium HGW-Spirochaetae-7]